MIVKEKAEVVNDLWNEKVGEIRDVLVEKAAAKDLLDSLRFTPCTFTSLFLRSHVLFPFPG